ncbi:MAG: S9 family peptidase [Planctomycetota bacterium]
MMVQKRIVRCVFVLSTMLHAVALENAAKAVNTTPISSVQWHPTEPWVTYVKTQNDKSGKRDVLYVFDASLSREKVLFDPATGGGATLQLKLGGFKWSPDGNALLLRTKDSLALFSLAGKSVRQLIENDPDIESPVFSPNNKRIAFIKKNNLYTVDTTDGSVRQLTTDGSETILNGKLDWVYGEELNESNPSGRAFAWSPDSAHIAFLRLDQALVPEFPIVDFLQTHATVLKQRYPKAGDPNSKAAVCVVAADGTPDSIIRMPRRENVEYILPEFTWTPDSKTLAVMTLNRQQNHLTLLAWSPVEKSDLRVVIEEKDPAWINVVGGPQFLKAEAGATDARVGFGAKFVWLSERDGWLHAYLYNANGTLARQITRGPWMITPNASRAGTAYPFQLDGAGEWIYFSSTEKDPRERHVCRARVDGAGTNTERLTREDGTHFQRLSPDGKYLVETYASIEQPQITRVLKNDGSVLAVLYQSGFPQKNASAEFHELTAPDGVKLYGRMIKPPNFDPAKKYPVIVDVYGGPSVQMVRNSWGVDDWQDQRLAQDGAIIWKMDNRGSFGRGHAWETAIFKNMGKNELADQLVGVEWLKKLPYVDGERFGIHGWSYGGYMTLYALTHAPEAFKCGVAGAPVTDWKYYDTIYTERYMGTPTDNPTGYLSASPMASARRLTAKLLLIHGSSDDNVHMQNTMNFVDALTKSGRAYELQIQPGQKHGFHGEHAWQYLTDRMIDFFKRNL